MTKGGFNSEFKIQNALKALREISLGLARRAEIG